MNKKTITTIIAALVILIVAVIVLENFGGPPVKTTVGAINNPSGGNVFFQVDSYSVGLNIGAKYANWVPLVMNLGQNQASWCNTTGRIVYAGGARFSLASTTPNGQVSAPNTLALSVGTSTKPTGSVTDSGNLFGGIINQLWIATSSSAFDSKSFVGIGGNAGTGLLASSTIPVSPSECVYAALESPGANVATSTATSTLRGYVLNGLIEYSY